MQPVDAIMDLSRMKSNPALTVPIVNRRPWRIKDRSGIPTLALQNVARTLKVGPKESAPNFIGILTVGLPQGRGNIEYPVIWPWGKRATYLQRKIKIKFRSRMTEK